MSEKIETLVDVSPPKPGDEPEEYPQLSAAAQDTVRNLVREARASGAALTGSGGLLKQVDKEHYGFQKVDGHGACGRGNAGRCRYDCLGGAESRPWAKTN